MATLQQETESGTVFCITMPGIACSFPCKIHPDALHLIEVADAWLVDRGKPIIAAWPESKLAAKLFAADHLAGSAFGLAVVLFYANAISTQRVIPILKFMGWYFMLDNCVDEPGMWGADFVKCRHIIESSMAVFVQSPPYNSSSQLRPLGEPDHVSGLGHDERTGHIIQELAYILTRVTAEWWSELCADMPLSQQARFCELIGDYLSNILNETPFRSACELPDVHAYLRIRSQTIGWYPLALLIEHTLCIELGPDVIANPLIKALKESVCTSIVIVNDITSFRKEYERGDCFNIIMVLCYQRLKGAVRSHSASPLPRAWSVKLATPELLQESMNEACAMVKKIDQECMCLIEKIKGCWELMEVPGMGAYLEALENHVAGNVYWHFVSARYGICVNGDNYKPTTEQIQKGMANVLAPRTFLFKRSHISH